MKRPTAEETPTEEQKRPVPLRERLVEGIQALRSSSDAMLVVAVWVIGGFTYGQEIVLYALVASERLRMGENGLAFLYTAFGVGGILAAGAASRAARLPRQGSRLVLAAFIAGSPLFVMAFVRVPVGAYPLLALEGASTIIVDVLVITTLQRILSAEVLGRAFGAIDSLLVAGMLLGSLAAPFLIHFLGLQGSLMFAGIVMMAMSLSILPRARAIDRRSAERAAALAPRVSALDRLEIFEGATQQTLENLAERLTEERVDPGTVVIREGDPADDLFVAVTGDLDVTTTDDAGTVRKIGDLASGDYFGEIGLLQGIPRTATVVARTACDLYRIPGEDFLRVVNEGASMSPNLLAGVQARLSNTRSVKRKEESAT